ncbi:MAG: glycerophosphodiester phosphodiesterase family protein, partial [Oxalobacteraceae bacterium]
MSYREFIADRTRDCAVVAHRGIWRAAPENSLAAIDQAISAGYDVVEIDICRAADGGLFLMHDETLERMAGLDQRPEALTSAELAALRLRYRDGGKDNSTTLERLPSLVDVFELTRGRIFLHLDVKQRDVIPDVIALAKAMGVDRQVDIWASLASRDDLAWIRQTILPHYVLFLAATRLNVPDADRQLALLEELSPAACEIYFDTLEELEALKPIVRNTGMALWVNTLDSIACAGFTDTAALVDPDA